MVKLAQQYNQQFKNCSFYLNTKPDLALFPSESFNFIYSSIVLQHIPPTYSKNYIKEFVRVLRHKGLAVFQLPSERAAKPKLRATLGLKRKKLLGQPVMDMHGIPREQVIDVIETAGGSVEAVDEDDYVGHLWRSFSYYVSKN
jgi:ubiquinone/menaquinone biosynthesis C-methylase UbiE